MGIFIKRPLCLFCFCFIGASVAACAFGGRYGLYAFFVCLACAASFFVLSFVFKKRKYGLIETFIALLFAASAFLSSYLSIYLPNSNAQRLCGEDKTVKFLVLSENYSSRYSSEYVGKLISVGGESVYIDASLRCEYEAEYTSGESVFTLASIEMLDGEEDVLTFPSDAILKITPIVEKEQAISDEYGKFNFDVLCAKMRYFVRSVFIERLDFDSAALSVGLLTGMKDDIATEVTRDFRRTGISHVLAVSGLHLSLIVGAAELVLKRLCVKRSLRCVVLSVLAFLLLMLSGFSASACRSVTMLLCAYFCYVLSRESDALTSLGIAGFLILLISPRSVGDIGFWLSFLATFGLVTWLSLFAEISRFTKKGTRRVARFLSSVIGKLCVALATTFCATVSILFVTWLVFGEISVVSLAANLVVTPLCELYLIISLLIFLFGGLPYASELFALAARFFTDLICELTGAFSSLEFSIVSIRYPFASVIVIVTTVLLFTLLILKLRRKLVILAVPFAAVISFCICLTVYNASHTNTGVTYINDEYRDALVLTESNSAVIFDIADGTYAPFYDAAREAEKNYATEIEAVVLTHYHTKYISSLDSLFREELVRRVYLPLPKEENELFIAGDVSRCAEENGVELVIYEYDENISISSEMSFCIQEPETVSYSSRKIIDISVALEEGILCYADSAWEYTDSAYEFARKVEESGAVVLGSHGPEVRKGTHSSLEVEYPTRLVSAARDEEKTIYFFYIK